ncbi:MAG: hypothetical protein DHS20C18_41000 [Saprospiraceae bacterium]|nr:MAG: hypothetical protein DHS20C18_41000 [Saprospiraceae bacterium]
MNAENFADYLKNPALLYQLSYEELKTLALQYPYCQNIQYLLVIKSKLENHKDYDKNLARAAASMTDRTFLYKKLKELTLTPLDTTEIILNEEVLELKELSLLEADLLEKIPLQPEEEMTPSVEQTIDINLSTISSDHEEEEEDIDFNFTHPEIGEAVVDPSQQEQEAAAGFRVTKNDIATLVALDEVLQMPFGQQPKEQITPTVKPIVEPDLIGDLVGCSEVLDMMLPRLFAHISPPAPLPKSAFRSWKRQISGRPIIAPPAIPEMAPSADKQEESQAKKENPKKKSKKTKVLEIAATSILEKQDIASETLAKLLEKQGQHRKAIKMYQRLILTIPEKSGYFAEQIEKLKNL